MPVPRVTTLRPEDIDHETTLAAAGPSLRDEDITPPSLVDRFLAAAYDARPRLPDLDTIVEALPTAGGIAGGLVGGVGGTVGGFGVGGVPGALGGAAVGGAGGEGLRRTIQQLRGKMPVDRSVGETLAGVGTEGAKQAAYEAGGQVLGRAATAGGRALYRGAVGRLPAAITTSFPNVVETLMKQRLPLNAAGRREVIQRWGRATETVKGLLEKAGNEGVRFDAGQIVAQPVLDLIDDIAKAPLGDADMRALSNFIDEYMRRHPGPLTPEYVKGLKKAAQEISGPIFKAINMGNVVGAETGVLGKFNQAVAKGTKEALETIPGVQAAEGEVADLIGAKKAMRHIANRAAPAAVHLGPVGTGIGEALSMVLGHGPDLQRAAVEYGVSDLLGRFLASPAARSQAGLALTQPQIAALFRQSPKLAAAVLAKMQEAANTPTGP